MNNIDFLGKGFSYPFRASSQRIVSSEGVKLVEESISILLGTRKGERVMRPDFGADLETVVFNAINANTVSMISYYVKECLDKFEPRIEVQEVTVNAEGPEKNRIEINIEYEMRSSNSKHNMVYPFYLEGSK